jgi:hypothetical protein
MKLGLAIEKHYSQLGSFVSVVNTAPVLRNYFPLFKTMSFTLDFFQLRQLVNKTLQSQSENARFIGWCYKTCFSII